MDENLRKIYDQKIDSLAAELARVASERDQLKSDNTYLKAEVCRMVSDRTYVIA